MALYRSNESLHATQRFITDPALYDAMSGDSEQGDKKKFTTHLNKVRNAEQIDLRAVTIQTIDPDHPDFTAVYAMLDGEFGAKGEIETPEVLRRRSLWNPSRPENNQPPLAYRLVILKHPRRTAVEGETIVLSVDGQEIIGVRDHNLIFRAGMVVVHLSHSLLAEHVRGQGLDTVLRTIPVLDAQSFANLLGYPNAPIILYSEQEPAPTVAEVQAAEHSQRVTGNNVDLADINMRRRRLKAYQSGLFKKIGLAYACAQPDFSTSEQITAKGGPTMVGLQGVWRIVGDECANKTTGRVLRTAVSAVYDMYEASGLDPRAIQQARESLQHYPPDEAEIPLVQPTTLIL